MDKRSTTASYGTEHLCLCKKCGKVAIIHDTINVAGVEGTALAHWHPKCFFKVFGVTGVLKHLPPDEQAKFRICDMPVAVMRRLLRGRK